MKARMTKIANMTKHAMRTLARHTGLPLVYAGVALLAVAYFTGLNNHNWLLLLALAIMLAGIIGFVYNEKRKEPY